MHFDFRRIEIEVTRHAIAERKRRFIGRPDFNLTIIIDSDRTCIRLDVGMKTQRRTKNVLENPRGLFETCLDVAVAPLAVGLNVG